MILLCAAVNADTSSAAGPTPVIGPAAAAFAALTTEPMPCRSPAAALSISGWVVRRDDRGIIIGDLLSGDMRGGFGGCSPTSFGGSSGSSDGGFFGGGGRF
jgi:hypothetical protein